MEKSGFRVLTKQTKQWLDKFYGESSPSSQMVEKWIGAKWQVRELAEAVGISIIGSVVKILHEDLGMRKLIAKWVPRLLTIDQKRQ